MLCEECHQKEACVMVLASVNGKEVTLHLCADCMKKQGMSMLRGDLEKFFTAMLASHLMPMPSQEKKQEKKKEDLAKTCPGCGLKLTEFRKTGLLGCKQCYQTFSEELVEVFTQKKKQNEGDGKSLSAYVDQLKQDMEDAVKEERYEDAARIRDELNALSPILEEKA